jgi:Uncharacterized protein conserved in bacteria
MDDHLLFYDGDCGFCHRSITLIHDYDKKKKFLFAPLQGETAKKYTLPNVDSIILLENFKSDKPKISIRGKAIARIIAILHPSLAFLDKIPAWMLDPSYRFVAYVRRHLFEKPNCLIPKNLDKSRFLP